MVLTQTANDFKVEQVSKTIQIFTPPQPIKRSIPDAPSRLKKKRRLRAVSSLQNRFNAIVL